VAIDGDAVCAVGAAVGTVGDDEGDLDGTSLGDLDGETDGIKLGDLEGALDVIPMAFWMEILMAAESVW